MSQTGVGEKKGRREKCFEQYRLHILAGTGFLYSLHPSYYCACHVYHCQLQSGLHNTGNERRKMRRKKILLYDYCDIRSPRLKTCRPMAGAFR
ncbi:hypothetical protein TNCV_2093481 [Trichonephila clavipes]|nr:hypothetical protein TNCV_2093481 [Trichonephila clavipes]